MTYMPTKSRKWLAGSVATALLASMFSMFTAVAPAGAAVGNASFTSWTTNKPVRATNTVSPGASLGAGLGTNADDSTAIILTLDDSFGNGLRTLAAGTREDTELFVKLISAPTSGTFTLMVPGAGSSAFSGSIDETSVLDVSTATDSWAGVKDESLQDGGGFAWTADDTKMAINFRVNLVGTYVIQAFLDTDNDSARDANEPFIEMSILASGAPVLSGTSSVTLTSGIDETATLTLTGGALAIGETYQIEDDSSANVAYYTYDHAVGNTNSYFAAPAVNDLSTLTYEDDTATLTGSMNWVRTGADTATLSIRIVPSGSDLTGSIRVITADGLMTGSATITLAASALTSAILEATVTAQQNVKSTIADDDSSAGTYDFDVLRSDSAYTISGTFEVEGASNYGKSATVALYAAAGATNATTALSTSAVATNSSTGIGSWSFTIPVAELNTAGGTAHVVIGNANATTAAVGTAPKRITFTARAAAVTPTWSHAGFSWIGATQAPGATFVAAAGADVTFGATIKDQFGNSLTGYKLKVTAGTRGGTWKYKTSTVGSSLSVVIDDTSTSTTSLSDGYTLTILDNLDVATSASTTVTVYRASPTLSALTIAGYAPSAIPALEINPSVPFDGEAGANQALTDDSDNLIAAVVTSSIAAATAVTFTGSAGVRFDGGTSTTTPNLGDAGSSAVRHDKGVTSVYVPTVLASDGAYKATAYFYCVTVGDCTVTATQGTSTISGVIAYENSGAAAFNVTDVKVNDVAATTGTSSVANKVKVSFKVTDVFGNAVKTLGVTGVGVDVMVTGVGSIDGLGSQGTLKTATNGTAQFYASSSAAGSMQIELDGAGGDFGDAASTSLAKPASADKKTVSITWTAAPVIVPEVVYAAPTLTVTKSGNKIILDGTAVEGEGDIIVYIKRVGTTKWVEQAATIEVAAPGDYNGMRIAPKSNVLIRVKQEGTGKFSNQVVVLK